MTVRATPKRRMKFIIFSLFAHLQHTPTQKERDRGRKREAHSMHSAYIACLHNAYNGKMEEATRHIILPGHLDALTIAQMGRIELRSQVHMI